MKTILFLCACGFVFAYHSEIGDYLSAASGTTTKWLVEHTPKR
jgi:hypothetical protein